MPTRDDELYFHIREREERARAARSADPGISALHLRFAEAYARRSQAPADAGKVAA